jgi:hypothetical protein
VPTKAEKKTQRAERQAERIAAEQAAYAAKVTRVIDYIRYRAEREPTSLWADPLAPYWLMQVPTENRINFEDWLAHCRAIDRSKLRSFLAEDASAIAKLLMEMMPETNDIELLGSISDMSDSDFASTYYRFRVGDQIIFAGGYNFGVVDPQEIRQQAEVLRGAADQLDAFVDAQFNKGE